MGNLNKKNNIVIPAALFVVFVVYTIVVSHIDIQPVGPLQSRVGMAGINIFFANKIGIHMIWYDLTNILGIFSLLIAAFFGFVGVFQLVTRKSLFKVDKDIIILGCFYVLVLACYVLFDKFAINYRPVMLEGTLEASYPSSHTMLSICIMSTAIMQLKWK
ncbi:MAG: phosphoesterase PA-phosphatase, partial [Eubacterium sp.]|nr:phosphoesterase PA-phosphatase [Candidatus Colimonas fimequi]